MDLIKVEVGARVSQRHRLTRGPHEREYFDTPLASNQVELAHFLVDG